MELKRILVATDLTEAADMAVQHAALIAKKAGAAVDLLHIVDKNSASNLAREGLTAEDLVEGMRNKCAKIKEQHGLESEFILHESDIFEGIPFIASKGEHQLMVIATHGVKGIRQNLFGAFILKVVRDTPIPTIIVQGEHPVWKNIDRIVFPVGGHETFDNKIDATCLIAGLFGSEVSIYAVERPGEEPSIKTLSNIEKAKSTFTNAGVAFREVKEDPTVYSVGYAKQTIEHAKSSNADLIAIMSVSSKEHYYFAQADKERILTNESRIPVMCCADTA